MASANTEQSDRNNHPFCQIHNLALDTLQLMSMVMPSKFLSHYLNLWVFTLIPTSAGLVTYSISYAFGAFPNQRGSKVSGRTSYYTACYQHRIRIKTPDFSHRA